MVYNKAIAYTGADGTDKKSYMVSRILLVSLTCTDP